VKGETLKKLFSFAFIDLIERTTRVKNAWVLLFVLPAKTQSLLFIIYMDFKALNEMESKLVKRNRSQCLDALTALNHKAVQPRFQLGYFLESFFSFLKETSRLNKLCLLIREIRIQRT